MEWHGCVSVLWGAKCQALGEGEEEAEAVIVVCGGRAGGESGKTGRGRGTGRRKETGRGRVETERGRAGTERGKGAGEGTQRKVGLLQERDAKVQRGTETDALQDKPLLYTYIDYMYMYNTSVVSMHNRPDVTANVSRSANELAPMPPKRSIRSVPSKSRRKPFSNKQKKLQLQQKRLRKRERDDGKLYGLHCSK